MWFILENTEITGSKHVASRQYFCLLHKTLQTNEMYTKTVLLVAALHNNTFLGNYLIPNIY